jgi:uncharacterized protein
MSKSGIGIRPWDIGTKEEFADMSLTITTTYALLLVPIWFVLFFSIVSARTDLKTSIGDGGNPALLLKMRRHGNFIEWVPFVLVLMIMAEAQGAGPYWLHAAGVLLVLGRLVHPFGLKIDSTHPLRIVGNSTNILATAIMAVALLRIVTGF